MLQVTLEKRVYLLVLQPPALELECDHSPLIQYRKQPVVNTRRPVHIHDGALLLLLLNVCLQNSYDSPELHTRVVILSHLPQLPHELAVEHVV